MVLIAQTVPQLTTCAVPMPRTWTTSINNVHQVIPKLGDRQWSLQELWGKECGGSVLLSHR